MLGEKVPPMLWLALATSVGGSALVVSSRSGPAEGGDSDAAAEYVGVAVQCASLLFSTGARLQMKLSEGVLASTEFMRFQYLGGEVRPAPPTIAVPRASAARRRRLRWLGASWGPAGRDLLRRGLGSPWSTRWYS